MRREEAITSAPASARPIAMARPSPVVPPVTTATLPDKSNNDWSEGRFAEWSKDWLIELNSPPGGRSRSTLRWFIQGAAKRDKEYLVCVSKHNIFRTRFRYTQRSLSGRLRLTWA